MSLISNKTFQMWKDKELFTTKCHRSTFYNEHTDDVYHIMKANKGWKSVNQFKRKKISELKTSQDCQTAIKDNQLTIS